MPGELRAVARQVRDYLLLPYDAKAEGWNDRRGEPESDPGIEAVINAGIEWLGRAQDCSASWDGGVARHFSLVKGWATSYPETTGYIVPTMTAYGASAGAKSKDRARRMLDWLVSIQFPEGGFQAGKIDVVAPVPCTFNTGQILLGLASGVAEFGMVYKESMQRAADWLIRTQDPDGCWRKYPTPFAVPGIKTYETHVAWGLLEAARLCPERGYGEAALANVRWAITQQRANGWLDNCCLSDPRSPLTHTLGYALRGMLEAHRFSGEQLFLDASITTADGLLSALRPDGFLPGQLDADWRPAAKWVCLTGSVQIAHSWLMLYRFTGDKRYRDAGFAANRYVRRTVRTEGRPDTRGGVKGSFPVGGAYGPYQYLNWACKFCIDSNALEREIRIHEQLELPV